jgi:hypothetical protein
MENRTVDIVLQHPDGRLVARLTVKSPPPATLAYGGQQWHRTSGFGPDDAVYRPDRPFVRPKSTEKAPVLVFPDAVAHRRR